MCENDPREFFIPLNPERRARSYALMQEAVERLAADKKEDPDGRQEES